MNSQLSLVAPEPLPANSRRRSSGPNARPREYLTLVGKAPLAPDDDCATPPQADSELLESLLSGPALREASREAGRAPDLEFLPLSQEVARAPHAPPEPPARSRRLSAGVAAMEALEAVVVPERRPTAPSSAPRPIVPQMRPRAETTSACSPPRSANNGNNLSRPVGRSESAASAMNGARMAALSSVAAKSAAQDSPATKLAMREDAAYNHGQISREEAQLRLVHAGGEDGLYLVRVKTPNKVFALSVMVKGEIKHHLIERSVLADNSPGNCFVFNGKRLKHCQSVDDLVELLQSLKAGDGSPVLLRPCPK